MKHQGTDSIGIHLRLTKEMVQKIDKEKEELMEDFRQDVIRHILSEWFKAKAEKEANP